MGLVLGWKIYLEFIFKNSRWKIFIKILKYVNKVVKKLELF